MNKNQSTLLFKDKTHNEITLYIKNQVNGGSEKIKDLIINVINYADYSLEPLFLVSQKTSKSYIPFYLTQLIKKNKKLVNQIIEKDIFPLDELVKFAINQSDIILLSKLIKQPFWYNQYNQDYFYLAFKKPNPEFILEFEQLLLKKDSNFNYELNSNILTNIAFGGAFINLSILSKKRDFSSPEQEMLIDKMFDDTMYLDSENYSLTSRTALLDFVLERVEKTKEEKIAQRFLSKIVDENKDFELFDNLITYFDKKNIKIKNEFYRDIQKKYIQMYKAYKEKTQLESTMTNELNSSKKLKI
jgi:hypothetical protein